MCSNCGVNTPGHIIKVTVIAGNRHCNMCGRIVGSNIPDEGKKHDTDKIRLDLMPTDVMCEVAKVYTFGAKKYGDRNWEKGLAYHRAYGAALRHMTSWWMRDDFDDETGIHHLAHAICELEFLLAFELRNIEHLDDRPILNNEVESKSDKARRDFYKPKEESDETNM